MTDNHAHDKDLLEKVDAVLDNGQASGIELIDMLAQTTPQARPDFQQGLEDTLLTRLAQQPAAIPADVMTEERDMTTKEKHKSKRRPNAGRRISYAGIAAVLGLIVVGGLLMMAQNARLNQPRGTMGDPLEVRDFPLTATTFVQQVTATAEVPMTLTAGADAGLDQFELTATKFVLNATQTAVVPLTLTAHVQNSIAQLRRELDTVYINEFHFSQTPLGIQSVKLLNPGAPVNLQGWSVSDLDGNTYTFGDITLGSDERITVSISEGSDTAERVHWMPGEQVWQEDDAVVVRDAEGYIVAMQYVPPIEATPPVPAGQSFTKVFRAIVPISEGMLIQPDMIREFAVPHEEAPAMPVDILDVVGHYAEEHLGPGETISREKVSRTSARDMQQGAIPNNGDVPVATATPFDTSVLTATALMNERIANAEATAAALTPTPTQMGLPPWDCAAEVIESAPLLARPGVTESDGETITGITEDDRLRVIERTYNGVVRVEAYLPDATYTGWLRENNLQMLTQCNLEYKALPSVTPQSD